MCDGEFQNPRFLFDFDKKLSFCTRFMRHIFAEAWSETRCWKEVRSFLTTVRAYNPASLVLTKELH
jgi:hypothetical protein